jgi:Fe-S-cluster-containing hydrogenase component 2
MEGLVVEVDGERCRGCGKCVQACIFRQVSLEDRQSITASLTAGESTLPAGHRATVPEDAGASPGIEEAGGTSEVYGVTASGGARRSRKVAVIGEECKGCGRCAMVCPEKAVRIRIEDPSYMEACVRRIASTVEVR